MARDLSQAGPRVTRQGRPTSNRDTIIPVRRSFDAGRREVNADVRNAAVGDRGARELLEIFGGVQRAAQDFQQYATAKYQQDDQNAAARGAADAAAGSQADPELEARFGGYRKAYSLGQAQKGYFDTAAALRTEIEEAVANGADVETVDGLIAERMGAFVLGEDGRPRDFGDPEANAAIAKAFSADRLKMLDDARKVIKERTDTEMNMRATTVAFERLSRGETDVESMFAAFAPGTDMGVAKREIITAAASAAEVIAEKDPAAADAMLRAIEKSTQKDGKTSSWSPTERAQLINARQRIQKEAEDRAEKLLKERSEANKAKLLDRFIGAAPGGFPSPAEIARLRAAGELDAETAFTMANLAERKIEEAQADAAARVSAAERAAKYDPDDDPSVASLQTGLLTGKVSTSVAVATVQRWTREGRFGDSQQSAKAIKAVMGTVKQLEGMDSFLQKKASSAIEQYTTQVDAYIAQLPVAQRRRARDLRDKTLVSLNSHWIEKADQPGVAKNGQPIEVGIKAAVTAMTRTFPIQ